MENSEKNEIKLSRQIDTSQPEVLTNPIYTPAFLKQFIGRLVRMEFLIGTNMLQDRTGILEEVGANYVALRSIESGNLLIADIYSIKFILISEGPFYPSRVPDHDFQI